MVNPIDWNTSAQFRDIVSKETLLSEIKTNMINLLQDYKGRGIENEDFYIAEAEKLFTRQTVPALADWKVIDAILRELSTIKEEGVMYENFIADVEGTLGVSDLVTIRNFIEYISGLGPDEPELHMNIDDFNEYTVYDVTATFSKNIAVAQLDNRATVHYKVRGPGESPQARITLYDAKREDVSSYEVSFTAGKYSKEVTIPASEFVGKSFVLINIPIDYLDWFAQEEEEKEEEGEEEKKEEGEEEENQAEENFVFKTTVRTFDKRGNESFTEEEAIYPVGRGIPRGFSKFEMNYKAGNGNWTTPSGANNIPGSARSFGSFPARKVNGYHQFRVRGYDNGTGWSPWAESPRYHLSFRTPPPPPRPPVVIPPKPKPIICPGTPNPSVTTTRNSAEVTWREVGNVRYYRVTRSGSSQFFDVSSGARLRVNFTGLSPGTRYTFTVTAMGVEDCDRSGSVVGTTKSPQMVSKIYRTLSHCHYIGQSFYKNRPGYQQPAGFRNQTGRDKPHWSPLYSRTSGSLMQGHWREIGGRGFAWRSGGTYQAYEWQSHGNHATFIEVDYAKMRRELKGKKIKKVTIGIRREGSIHGWPNKGLPVYLYTHNQEIKNPGRTPRDAGAIFSWDNRKRITHLNRPVTESLNFSRKQAHHFSNDKVKKLVQNIVDGHMKGFAIIHHYGRERGGNSTFDNTHDVARGEENYMRFNPDSFSVSVDYEN